MSDTSQFSVDIAKFCKKAGQNCDLFVREFNQDLAKAVQMETPVITGFLRGSWSASIGRPDTSPANGRNNASVALVLAGVKAGDVVYHTNNAKYGRYVEFGTSRMSPRAFVRRTVAKAAQIARATFTRLGIR